MNADGIPDFWADPSIKVLTAQQGQGPIDDVSVLHGDFWPEEERIEGFMAALAGVAGAQSAGQGL